MREQIEALIKKYLILLDFVNNCSNYKLIDENSYFSVGYNTAIRDIAVYANKTLKKAGEN